MIQLRPPQNLTSGEKQQLLQLARQSIRHNLETGTRLESTSYPDIDWPGGLFVTLRKHGELRGCIGTIETDKPLVEELSRLAVQSATADWRFTPVKSEELREIAIEISLLTTPQPINNVSEIEIGQHGIIMENDGRRSLFLPHVATEQGWDRAATIKHLAEKGGFSVKERKSARYLIFEALIFSETD